MQTRVEKDMLGNLEIDCEAYYGIHTQRAVENFKISSDKIANYPEFIRAMILTKKACAMANGEIGILPEEKTNLIIKACDHILSDITKFQASFPVDVFQGGAGTSVNMNTNEVIANVALELDGKKKGDYSHIHPNDHVNKSQSTNDAFPTGFRVALYFSIGSLIKNIRTLNKVIEKKSLEFKEVLKMGRTQLQDAIPMSLRDEFKAWKVNLQEEERNLERIRKLILEVNLGATAIGTGANAHKDFSKTAIQKLIEITEANFIPAKNLIEATSDLPPKNMSTF